MMEVVRSCVSIECIDSITVLQYWLGIQIPEWRRQAREEEREREEMMQVGDRGMTLMLLQNGG